MKITEVVTFATVECKDRDDLARITDYLSADGVGFTAKEIFKDSGPSLLYQVVFGLNKVRPFERSLKDFAKNFGLKVIKHPAIPEKDLRRTYILLDETGSS